MSIAHLCVCDRTERKLFLSHVESSGTETIVVADNTLISLLYAEAKALFNVRSPQIKTLNGQILTSSESATVQSMGLKDSTLLFVTHSPPITSTPATVTLNSTVTTAVNPASTSAVTTVASTGAVSSAPPPQSIASSKAVVTSVVPASNTPTTPTTPKSPPVTTANPSNTANVASTVSTVNLGAADRWSSDEVAVWVASFDGKNKANGPYSVLSRVFESKSIDGSTLLNELDEEWFRSNFTTTEEVYRKRIIREINSLRTNNGITILLSATAITQQTTIHSTNSVASSPSFPSASGMMLNASDLKYSLNDVIGSGAFKTIYRGRWLGLNVAVGVLNASASMSLNDITSFMKEIEILKALKHPNIISLFGSVHDPSTKKVTMIMECMQISLYHSIYQKTDEKSAAPLGSGIMSAVKNWSLKMKLSVMLGIARGVLFLHKSFIIHRYTHHIRYFTSTSHGADHRSRVSVCDCSDLKSLNILLTSNGEAKISDFGCSKLRSETKTLVSKAGTPVWMAPEIMTADSSSSNGDDGKKVDGYASDVYSVALIFYEIISCLMPFKECSDNAMALLNAVVIQKKRPDLKPFLSLLPPALPALLQDMWLHEASQRPTMEVVVERLDSINATLTANDGMCVTTVMRERCRSLIRLLCLCVFEVSSFGGTSTLR